MAKLTKARRAKLPRRDFAEPRKRKYPLEDRKHAISALGRVSKWGTKAERRRVRREVKQRYPSLHVKGI